MSISTFEIYVDCGFSKLRASAFHKTNLKKTPHVESEFLFDHTEISTEVQKIITFLEKNTDEYIDIGTIENSLKQSKILDAKIDGQILSAGIEEQKNYITSALNVTDEFDDDWFLHHYRPWPPYQKNSRTKYLSDVGIYFLHLSGKG